MADDDEMWSQRDAYFEYYLHGACTTTTPLLAAKSHFFFEPGASLFLSTLAACLVVLARRLHVAWASRKDPRDEVALSNSCALLSSRIMRANNFEILCYGLHLLFYDDLLHFAYSYLSV
jgi:L-rhamnose isomerase